MKMYDIKWNVIYEYSNTQASLIWWYSYEVLWYGEFCIKDRRA